MMMTPSNDAGLKNHRNNMNIELAKSLQQSALSGKALQYRSFDNVWRDFTGDYTELTLKALGSGNWRVKPKTNRKPLTAKQFPKGTVVRFRSEPKTTFHQVVSRNDRGITIVQGGVTRQFNYDNPLLINGDLRRKVPGPNALWVRSYAKVESVA